MLGVAALVLTLVLFQVTYFPGQLDQANRLSLESKGTTVVRLISAGVGSGLEFRDLRDIQAVLAGTSDDPDIVYIAVLDREGKVFTSQGAPPGGFLEPLRDTRTAVRDAGAFVQVEAPVTSASGAQGHLVVCLSATRVQELTDQGRQQAWLWGLLALVLGWAAAWWGGRNIGRRLSSFAEALDGIAQGHLDQPHLAVRSADEIGRMAGAFNTMVDTLRSLEGHVETVAGGRLTVHIDEQGDLAESLRRMVSSQRQLVLDIVASSSQISSTAAEILATARQQERGAAEQASVVEETGRTMDSLLGSATQVSSSAQQVMADAEQAHAESQLTTQRIDKLSGQVDRIAEILKVIKDIANKSDLLALNAALEGSRAGEAGRGFSLVATQMQRLTEQVVDAVGDIRQITEDIDKASAASVAATEAATTRASGTAASARRINLISKQQQSGTEQVGRSMRAFGGIIAEQVSASTQSKTAAEQLNQLAANLQVLVARFELEQATQDADEG